jgi:SAM-dependent methyltransferase
VAEPEHLRATRAGYDAIAVPYAELFAAELADAPLDRALLGAFAETVLRDHGTAGVLEVGSGPGAVAGHLHHLGLAVRGIDLSPAMVDLARRAHPAIAFEVGDMGRLDTADGELAGVVAWYSLIHVPAARRAGVVAEFHRVLRPGGHVLLAFQVGDDTLHLTEAFGRPIALDFHRLRPDAVVELLAGAGFVVTARLEKAPEPGTAASRVPQGFVIATKPAEGERGPGA